MKYNINFNNLHFLSLPAEPSFMIFRISLRSTNSDTNHDKSNKIMFGLLKKFQVK